MKATIYLFLIVTFINSVTNAQSNRINTQNLSSEISFLQIKDTEKFPSKNAVSNSITALQGEALKPLDIAILTRAFTHSKRDDQNLLLLKINSKNEALAETLILFRKRLGEAQTDEKKIQHAVEVLFMHFITNTNGGFSIKEQVSTTELYELLKRYSQSLGLDLLKNANGQTTFRIADKTIVCENCNLTNFGSLRDAGITVNRIRYGRDDVISAAAFDFNVNTYTLENAAIMADFCNLVYFHPQFIKNQLVHKEYSFFRWIEGQKLDTEVLITRKGNYQIICFRGTNSITDIAIDLWFNKKTAFGGEGKVHAGFQNALNEVWPELEQHIDKNLKTIITGHSLGGALAQLLAYRLSLKNYNVSGVYTYGSPRVGNSTFKATYNNRLATKTYLHINNQDAVPTIPLEIMGFTHLGNSERRFDLNHKITLVNEKGNIQRKKEISFDQLDPIEQEKVRRQMQVVSKSMRGSSQFLRTSPYTRVSMSYETNFEEGKIDDHNIDQYLFKMACAIVDREMSLVKKN